MTRQEARRLGWRICQNASGQWYAYKDRCPQCEDHGALFADHHSPWDGGNPTGDTLQELLEAIVRDEHSEREYHQAFARLAKAREML